ncbi:hypothetical protein BDDG_12247 [Blastomyces dermatitidis ATCC 18188]|uniref:Uncharacterized protein n=1 Tax=Ajellomyces dermatitidis (strain ATCC 18188 / CBS 674.68) TaxID=653446 RepID=A0A0J9ENR6_AJEDA|nr:hypothetical protein BDDG_12247 [Blastomyces dermatitidis ATCC 18188]
MSISISHSQRGVRYHLREFELAETKRTHSGQADLHRRSSPKERSRRPGDFSGIPEKKPSYKQNLQFQRLFHSFHGNLVDLDVRFHSFENHSQILG